MTQRFFIAFFMTSLTVYLVGSMLPAFSMANDFQDNAPALVNSANEPRVSSFGRTAMMPALFGNMHARSKTAPIPLNPGKEQLKENVITNSHVFNAKPLVPEPADNKHSLETPTPELQASQSESSNDSPVGLLNIQDDGNAVDEVLKPAPNAPPTASKNTSTAINTSTPLLPTSPLSGFTIPNNNGGTLAQTKVVKGPKKIVINIPARQLSLYQGQTLVKTYPVGVGRPGFPTPVGKFEVIRKVLNPGWENPYLEPGKVRILPGNDNPLGTRWIGFKDDGKGEYGIHGTDDPPSVGKYSSHGCVRMYVNQAEDLYNQIVIGTPVEVVYQPVVIQQKQNQLQITVYPDTFHRGVPSSKLLLAQIQRQYPNSKINLAQLQQALRYPSQKPVLVGQIEVPKAPSTAQTSTQNQPEIGQINQ